MNSSGALREISADSSHVSDANPIAALHERRAAIISNASARPRVSVSQGASTAVTELAEPNSNAVPVTVPLVSLPEFRPELPRRDRFQALQEWEGVVTRIEGETFNALLIDITANEIEPGEVAEFSVDDLQDQDRDLLKEGAIFRWVIGFAISASGIRTRGSRIHFRRALGRHTSGQTAAIRFEGGDGSADSATTS